jgi:hypothetical protein
MQRVQYPSNGPQQQIRLALQHVDVAEEPADKQGGKEKPERNCALHHPKIQLRRCVLQSGALSNGKGRLSIEGAP